MKTPEDYLPQEGTLAYQIARENAVKDMAKWDCNRARNLVTKYPPESRTRYLPVHSDGRQGPSFDSMTAASLWVISVEESHEWRVELSRETFTPTQP